MSRVEHARTCCEAGGRDHLSLQLTGNVHAHRTRCARSVHVVALVLGEITRGSQGSALVPRAIGFGTRNRVRGSVNGADAWRSARLQSRACMRIRELCLPGPTNRRSCRTTPHVHS